MQWSTERILTTHTGSLPRPPELTRLYVRRIREKIEDDAETPRYLKTMRGAGYRFEIPKAVPA